MKKLIILAAALCIAATASAQWSWGTRLGVNVAALTDSGLSNFDHRTMKPGFFGGLLANYRFNQTLSLQGELYYSRQGQRYVTKAPLPPPGGGSIIIDKEIGRQQLNYLNLPVLLKINIVPKLTFDLGPQIGYLLSRSAFEKTHYHYFNEGRRNVTDKIKDKGGRKKFESFDYAAAAGFSYLAFMNLELSARYVYSFADCTKNDGKDVRNNTIQLGAEIRF